MKKSISIANVLVATAIIVVAAILFMGRAVWANPSYWMPSDPSGGAGTSSTTVSYLTAGNATTTLTFDTTKGYSSKLDAVSLVTQFAGSSTGSVLNIDVQYSQDGIDWYEPTQGWSATSLASSSPSLQTNITYTFNFSSSTINKGAGITATTTKIIRLETPTRYVRAIFTLPVGSLAGAVWGQFIGVRQNP